MNRIREELLRRVPESRPVLERLDRFDELAREPDIGPDDPYYLPSLFDIRIDLDTYLLGPAPEAPRGDRQAEDLARRVLAWLEWIAETWRQEEWLVDRLRVGRRALFGAEHAGAQPSLPRLGSAAASPTSPWHMGRPNLFHGCRGCSATCSE